MERIHIQILCKTTPTQVARQCVMDIRDIFMAIRSPPHSLHNCVVDTMGILMAIPCHGAIKGPPHSRYHCVVDIMDILMAIPCHGAIKSPPHRELKFPIELQSPHKSPPQSLYHCAMGIHPPHRCKFPVELPCQPTLPNTTSI